MKFFQYEKYQLVPAVINLRQFYNNKLFCIELELSEQCTGSCELSNKVIKKLYLPPFLELPESAFKDKDTIGNIQDIYNNYIYKNFNQICNKTECSKERTGFDNFYIKIYKVISLPMYLIINTNINEYNNLLLNKDFINRILENSIKVYGIQYILESIISMPSVYHYTVIFDNHNNLYGLDQSKWYYYDDLGEALLVELIDHLISLENIRENNALVLFIYKRTIFN